MFIQIENQLGYLQEQFFSGSIKFGIEKGVIRAYYISSKLDSLTITNAQKDIKSEILKLYPDENNFYGTIEYYLKFGKVMGGNFSVSLQGEQLQDFMKEKTKCKSVKIAVKKSNG